MGHHEKKPSLTYRLAARSLPEVVAGMEAAVSRLGASRAVLFRGRKFSAEAFLNALVIRALTMPQAELERLLASGTADYERMIGGAPLPSPGGESGGGGGGLVLGSGSDAPAPASGAGDEAGRRRRRAR